MTQFQPTLLARAGMDIAEASIGSRLVSGALCAMAAEEWQLLRDNLIAQSARRRVEHNAVRLAQQARAAEEAADLGARASNTLEVAERRLKPLARTNGAVRDALYMSGQPSTDPARERAAGVVVLEDHRAAKSGNPLESDAA